MDDLTKFTPNIVRYKALMDVVRNRLTFRPDVAVPREHVEMILEAARLVPGFVVVAADFRFVRA